MRKRSNEIQPTLHSLLALVMLLLAGCGTDSTNLSVDTLKAFDRAVEQAAPGDTIVLKNGRWENVSLLFEAQGSADAPIVLRAETPGKVTIEGASNLRIAGEHLVVSGLVFVNGHTPGGAVIEYRKDRETVANDCRVTECVIDGYNPDDRFSKDNWVLLYGKRNRFDHNYLVGKKNSGVTLAVKLDDPKNQENHHRIDHNFFGYRPRLGSNGGETMRVGVSTYSLTSSYTTIEENFFYRCNGETEVVSIKASDNIIRRNTFYECEGSLVMRHGDRNIIDSNFFLGNNRPETGGVRVINTGHKIFNNYFQGLKGGRFRAALAVMNGVPNSLLNRYHKAKDAIIANNTFIDCDNIELGVGSDFERTDVPENILIANNIFYHQKNDAVFKALDDISGFTFSGNLARTASGKFRYRGFTVMDPALKSNAAGILVATSKKLSSIATKPFEFIQTDINGNTREGKATVGAIQFGHQDTVKPFATAENTGVRWYSQEAAKSGQGSGRVISVQPGEDTIFDALESASAGDIIELSAVGKYQLTQMLSIDRKVTIRAAAKLASRPLLLYTGTRQPFSFISIENGGKLRLSGVAFDGNAADVVVAESAIRTSKDPMIEHYSLYVENCEFSDFQESRYNAFKAYQSTFADTVAFRRCIFTQISGDALSLASEKEDRGKYNAEYVILENCVFANVMGAALNLYRGGNDESTFGPHLTVDHCVFETVNNKEQGSVLKLIGVQVADIRNSIFVNSGRGGRSVKFDDNRWDKVQVRYCNLYNSGKVDTYYDQVIGRGMVSLKPQFVNPAKQDYRLKPASPLAKMGIDGEAIGLPN